MTRTLSRSRWALTLSFAVALGICVAPVAAFAAPGDTSRVSMHSFTAWGEGSSSDPSVSRDGRYVAFSSYASDLVVGDTDGYSDIFVYDRQAGTTRRVSVNSEGDQGNNHSLFAPSISADGNRVAFESNATNLVPDDTNQSPDVFVRDLTAGTTTRVSVGADGAEHQGESGSPSISADGRYVAFSSVAPLFPGDTGDDSDVFVRGLETPVTTRVSVGLSGAESSGWSVYPAISADGSHVAFQSDASNLVEGDTNSRSDIFVWTRAGGATIRASLDSGGTQGNGESAHPSISADGLIVAFESEATNLVAGDEATPTLNVFVRDLTLTSPATTRVSESPSGTQGDDDSEAPSISDDGRYVAFESMASNLSAIEVDGALDVFVHDRVSQATTCASVDSSGRQGSSQSYAAALSGNGLFVAFTSASEDLVPGDTNKVEDVFINEVTFLPRAAVTVSTGSNSSLGYGSTFVIRGTLTSGTNVLPGLRVVLQSRVPGGEYSDSSYTATTTPDGTFYLGPKPATKTYYRVRFAGTSDYSASGPSTSVYALPKAYVYTPHAPSYTMSRSRYYTVWGSLKPRHAVGSYPVRIYKWRKVSGHWKPYGYTNAKVSSNSSSSSRYSRSIRLSSSGSWRLRAYAPADAGHAAAWSSGSDYVTVR